MVQSAMVLLTNKANESLEWRIGLFVECSADSFLIQWACVSTKSDRVLGSNFQNRLNEKNQT